MLDYTRVGQRTDIADSIRFAFGDLAQDTAHDLARTGLRQSRCPLDHIRCCNRTDFPAHVLDQFGLQLVGVFVAELKGHVGIDALPLDGVREANHGGFGHGRMRHKRTLDLGGTHAVPRNVDHVVDAAQQPVVALFVDTASVTREVVALVGAEVGLDVAVMSTI